MSPKYEYEVLERPSRNLSASKLSQLHSAIRELGLLCFDPLPEYQVFSSVASEAFDDKIIVVARQNESVVAFVSAVVLDIPSLANPVIHTGLTVIHPDHRRSSGIIQSLFAHLFLNILSEFPEGCWITTLAEVISSLVHISKYAINVFPSPEWDQTHAPADPSATHLLIARAVAGEHRAKMLISSEAQFDEGRFVFRGSNDHSQGRVFMKDVDDPKHWHRDQETSKFYRKYFRKAKGDEVLQVGFLDPQHMIAVARSDRYKGQWAEEYSKL